MAPARQSHPPVLAATTRLARALSLVICLLQSFAAANAPYHQQQEQQQQQQQQQGRQLWGQADFSLVPHPSLTFARALGAHGTDTRAAELHLQALCSSEHRLDVEDDTVAHLVVRAVTALQPVCSLAGASPPRGGPGPLPREGAQLHNLSLPLRVPLPLPVESRGASLQSGGAQGLQGGLMEQQQQQQQQQQQLEWQGQPEHWPGQVGAVFVSEAASWAGQAQSSSIELGEGQQLGLTYIAAVPDRRYLQSGDTPAEQQQQQQGVQGSESVQCHAATCGEQRVDSHIALVALLDMEQRARGASLPAHHERHDALTNAARILRQRGQTGQTGTSGQASNGEHSLGLDGRTSRALLQNIIIQANPLDRIFNGYASTYDLLALLTLALNFNQAPNVAGTNNSANSAQLRTFKGFTFPFGVNFATSNTFAGKTKAQLDATVKSNQAAALSDGAADGRAVAFPLVGDVQVVQGLISSALSQSLIDNKPAPPPRPPAPVRPVLAAPNDTRAIPRFVVNYITVCIPTSPGSCSGQSAGNATSTGIYNYGSSLSAANLTRDIIRPRPPSGRPGQPPGRLTPPGPALPGRPAAPDTTQPGSGQGQGLEGQAGKPREGQALPSQGQEQGLDPEQASGGEVVAGWALQLDPALVRGFGDLSVAGNGEGYSMYRPPTNGRMSTPLELEEYLYYNGWYNDATFEAMDPAGVLDPPSYSDYMFDPYFYVDYEDCVNATGPGEMKQADNGGVTHMCHVPGSSSFRQGGVSSPTANRTVFNISDPVITPENPFEVFLASSLEYGRAGQYNYFYTNYFRFLYTYYNGPQPTPATALSRQRTTSYVKQNERASTAGRTQNAVTGVQVAAVGNSQSVAASNSLSQSLRIADIFGNTTYIPPPQVLTRFAGAQSSAVAFGQGNYYQQPSVAKVDASSQANANKGYTAGASAALVAYSSASQSSGVRGQVLGSTGQANINFDVGG